MKGEREQGHAREKLKGYDGETCGLSFGKEQIAGGRSQDGGGIGRGDHFLFYKFMERTTER